MFLFELLINQHIFITPNTNMILFNPKLNLRFFPFSALYTIKPTNIKKINSIRKNIYSFIYILLREFSLLMYIMGVNPSNRRLRASKQVKITRDPQKIWSVSRITNSSILGYNGNNAKSFDKNTMVYQTHNDKNTDNSTDPGNIIARGYLTKMFDSANDKKMYFISEKDQVFSIKKNIFLKNNNAATEIPSHYVEFDIKMNNVNQIEAEQILPTTNTIDLEQGDIYEIIHPGIDISGNTLLWNNIDDAQNSANKIYIKGTRFTLKQDFNLSMLTNNTRITTPAKIFRIQNPGQNDWNAEPLLFNFSLTKVGSRKGSGFGIGNQGGNSLFSFKLNNRIKPHNNWNPLQLNNPNFNSKLYQKNDNHTSFPYSKFCNYRRRQDVPRFMKFFPPNSYNNDFNFPFPIGSRKDLFGEDGAKGGSNIAGMKKPKYDIQYRTKFSKAKNRH